eukprot:scaffold41463_cov75-Phaeocystis_antarctica.AAC.2
MGSATLACVIKKARAWRRTVARRWSGSSRPWSSHRMRRIGAIPRSWRAPGETVPVTGEKWRAYLGPRRTGVYHSFAPLINVTTTCKTNVGRACLGRDNYSLESCGLALGGRKCALLRKRTRTAVAKISLQRIS